MHHILVISHTFSGNWVTQNKGLSFMALDTSKMRGRIGGTVCITAARTSRHGGICCLKKFLAETNKHYCMNTDSVIAQNICLSAVHASKFGKNKMD